MRRPFPLLIAAASLLAACASPAPPPAAPTPAPAPPAAEPAPEPEPPPPPPAPASRDVLGSVAYSLPVTDHPSVVAELDFLVGERHNVIATWYRRGEPYRPFIERTLADHGLPSDLYHLAMIESGFVPTARSHAGAVGMWQFMPATGRLEGLRVDAEVDERMDPVRSTRAAARHLVRLYGAFGDWPLAAAAYNAGSGRVTRSLQRFGARDFWDLSARGDLAAETRQYVPRLYAVTIAGRDPTRFGIPRSERVEPFAFDSVFVDVETPLAELAAIADISPESLRRLNPHLIREVAPADYHIWVPTGLGSVAQERYLASDFRRRGGFAEYRVRPGDSLWRLAERSGLSAAEIRRSNGSVDFERLRVGQRIRLAPDGARRLEAAVEERARLATATATAGAAQPAQAAQAVGPVVEGPAESATEGSPNGAAPVGATPPAAVVATAGEHVVAAGETLWEIGRHHGVSVDALREANGLGDGVIRPGQRLVLPERDRAVAPAASGPVTIEHEVAPGETLWGIARRYEVPVASIREANGLGDDRIVPGQRLRIER
jgi:membrane-bound lytic murein transglycosylase D